VSLSIDLDNASNCEHPALANIEQWVGSAIAQRMDEAEISIRITDREEISELNKTYRNKDGATNVLSFPADLPEALQLPLLGDLVICAPVVEDEAQQQGKPLQAHWAHMVIHGTLHLLGYDHIDDNDAEIMENLEVEILASLGFSNPYINQQEMT
jgi:probable rRNA maturation factor